MWCGVRRKVSCTHFDACSFHTFPEAKLLLLFHRQFFLRCTGVWNGMHDRFKKMQLVLTHLTRILFSFKIYSRFSERKKINRQSFHNFLPFFSLCLIKNYNLIKTEKREKETLTPAQHNSIAASQVEIFSLLFELWCDALCGKGLM